jgi:hypothetical protein
MPFDDGDVEEHRLRQLPASQVEELSDRRQFRPTTKSPYVITAH